MNLRSHDQAVPFRFGKSNSDSDSRNSKQTLQKDLNRVYAAIVLAGNSFHAWTKPMDVRARRKYIDVLNRYVDYFMVCDRAHFVTIVTSLANAFAECADDDDSVTFASICRRAMGRGLLSQTAAALVTGQLKKYGGPIGKIMKIRNKIVAHLDPATDVERTLKRAQLTVRDIRALIDSGFRIFNLMSPELGGFTSVRTFNDVDEHMRSLLDKLSMEAR